MSSDPEDGFTHLAENARRIMLSVDIANLERRFCNTEDKSIAYHISHARKEWSMGNYNQCEVDLDRVYDLMDEEPQ